MKELVLGLWEKRGKMKESQTKYFGGRRKVYGKDY